VDFQFSFYGSEEISALDDVFWLFGLKGNVVDVILSSLFRSDVTEHAEFTPELRFSPDDSVANGLCLAELELETVVFHFNDCGRVDGNGGLLETLVALTRPGLLTLFTPVEFRVEAGSTFILNKVRGFNALFQEPGTHHGSIQLFTEGLQFILVFQTEQVVFSRHVQMEAVAGEVIYFDFYIGN